jgi:hypothetical protein
VVDGEVPRPRCSGAVAEVIMALMRKEPDSRMPLEEVRQRLRDLIDDPDDPLYPGSPDAPTIGAGIPMPAQPMRAELTGARPAPPPPPAPLPPAPTGARAPVGASPLAPSPGPLPVPGRPPSSTRSGATPARTRRPAETASVSGWAAVGLVVAGAAVVLAGAVGGWTATRVLGGQSAATTLNVTSAAAFVTQHSDALGFSVPVPQDWAEYRDEPVDGYPSVSFVSPDGGEELMVQRSPSSEEAQIVDGTLEEPPAPVANDAVQLRYSAEDRTSWRRIVPADKGVWTITLTVPRSAAGATSAALFGLLASGFAPTTA